MAIEFLCRKIGMTQYFDDSGECIPVTVLEASPNRVVQKKTPERDGYSALQLGYGERRLPRSPEKGSEGRKPRRAHKPEQGHFARAELAPLRHLKESRVTPEELEQYEVGQEIAVDIFSQGQRVDVIGTTKGRGTAGVVKRHGFAIKRKTHGTHEFFRHGGAIGAGAYPGKVLKGMKMAGRLGNSRVTALNVQVVRVDADKRLLFVRGGVPGHNDGVVRVRPSVRARA